MNLEDVKNSGSTATVATTHPGNDLEPAKHGIPGRWRKSVVAEAG